MELFMGMAFSVLLWAIIAPVNPYSSKLKQWSATIISLLLIYVISYFHQLAFFCIVFAILFELIWNKRWKDKHIWIVFIFTILWFYLRIIFFTTSSYEQAKMEGQEDMFSYLPDFFSLKSWTYFKIYFWTSLKSLSLTFFFCLIILTLRRQWLLLSCFFLFNIGYVIFMVLLSSQGVDELFFQSYSTLFGFFNGVAFLYLINDKFPKSIALFLISFLLFTNVKGIYKAHFIQTERINYFDRLTEYGNKMSNKKYILSTKNIPNSIIFYHQFLPFEILQYSSIKSFDSTLTFFPAENMNEFDTLLNNKNLFLGVPWDALNFQSNTISRNFYHLPSTKYVKVNTSQKDSSFKESIFNNKNIFINVPNNELHSNVYNFIVAPIKILNTSEQTINSIPDGEHSVYLSYHLYNKDGILISWDNARTTLEVDIKDEYTQGLMVYLPSKKGEYIIEVDFVTDGIRWWNATTRFNLIVE
jgi:hypothetical protein